MIFHCFKTTAFVDKILVFKNGTIVESGNHRDLLEQQGVYHSMYAAQASLYK
jgi:ABC-type multidrug transport system fused ATPase/permease subunit